MKANLLYQQDFYQWTQQMAEALQHGHYEKLDLENLAEEIESLGRSEKRELRSRLQILLMHLLKWQYQPQRRSHSWQSTITEQRVQINGLLQDSPSLRPYLVEIFEDCYETARTLAAGETGMAIAHFPTSSLYSIEETLQLDYWIDSPDVPE
ncbi:MAG: DUF29 domain-containing protein [Oculatellaceae cyanobacterium Prado106]|nr:DUF29 domain-containing protein [Oculatellaceae cyanobacterium Prado106]